MVDVDAVAAAILGGIASGVRRGEQRRYVAAGMVDLHQTGADSHSEAVVLPQEAELGDRLLQDLGHARGVTDRTVGRIQSIEI